MFTLPELRKMTAEDFRIEFKKYSAEMSSSRFHQRIGQAKDTHRYAKIRSYLAQLKTLATELGFNI